MWNDTGYTPASNLADLLGRAATSNYFSPLPPLEGAATTLPTLRVHNNYYIEANLLYTPSLAAGTKDVLFVIGE